MTTKKWYQSKTIWGVLIAFLGFALTHFLQVPDVQLPQDSTFDELQNYAQSIKDSHGNIEAIITQLMVIVGTIIAFIGRIKAETKITK